MADDDTDEDVAKVETDQPDDYYNDPEMAKLARKWHRKLRQSEKYFESRYWASADKIVKRYRDERDDMAANTSKRFNLLWSNVQTLQPAVYSREPKIYVSRRYQDRDPIARVSSQVLERCLSYQMDKGRFHDEMLLARDDYLLAGRGTHWQRYEGKVVTLPPEVDPATGQLPTDPETGQPLPPQQKLKDEFAPTDFVNYKDFLHDPKSVWKKVKWVSIKDLVTKDEAKDKGFHPLCIEKMSFTHRRTDEEGDRERSGTKRDTDSDCALVYEVWDKVDLRVIWLSKDLEDKVLRIEDDFMEFDDFFPCPPPLYATMTTNTLVPRPDYVLYQDQAKEIDALTTRIDLLTKALAVRGSYDSSNPSLKTLLDERAENFLVPVNNWAAFAEKGGLTGAVSFLPIEQIIKVLSELIAKRALLIQDVYQITGISDIVRGQTQPHETATAQSLKGNFATLRLEDRRGAIARFAKDSLILKAQVITKHFEPEIIRRMSGFDFITEVETLKNMHGPEAVEMLWDAVMEMFKDTEGLGFRIDIETDSTIQMDRYEEQQRRTEFLTAVSRYIAEMAPIMAEAPMLGPLIGQMLLFGVRGFNVGRELESEIESLVAQIMAQARQPQGPRTDPKAEAEAAKTQTETQVIQQGAAADQQERQLEMVHSEQEHQLEMQSGRQKLRQQVAEAAATAKLNKAKLQQQKSKPNGAAK